MLDFYVIGVKGNKKGFAPYTNNRGSLNNGLDFLPGKEIILLDK